MLASLHSRRKEFAMAAWRAHCELLAGHALTERVACAHAVQWERLTQRMHAFSY